MTSQTQLCNVALLSMGAQTQINSFNDGTPEANACSQLYSYVFGLLARTAHWNSLRKQGTLTLSYAAAGTPENPTGTGTLPPSPWLYQYQYPSDCVAMRFIVPSWPNAGVGGIPLTTASYTQAPFAPPPVQIPFQIAYGVDAQNNPITTLLTNQMQAQAVYTVNQQNPVVWDSLFQGAFVSSMSVYLAYALTLNLPLAKAKMEEVNATITQARVSDGNEGVTVQDHIPDWIQARNSGALYGYNDGAYGSCYGTYQNMVWPGG